MTRPVDQSPQGGDLGRHAQHASGGALQAQAPNTTTIQQVDTAIVKELVDALEGAPIIGRLEAAYRFRARQDVWLCGAYQAALAKVRP